MVQIHGLDHVNLRTSRLDEMVAWYRDILGLPTGPRPDFRFPGAWLYVGDQAAVHLVGVDSTPDNARSLTLEHFAFAASGLKEFTENLETHGIRFTLDPVPGFDVVQVNLHDPDGNHIHVDFAASEVQELNP